jgi:hypothetical protein
MWGGKREGSGRPSRYPARRVFIEEALLPAIKRSLLLGDVEASLAEFGELYGSAAASTWRRFFRVRKSGTNWSLREDCAEALKLLLDEVGVQFDDLKATGWPSVAMTSRVIAAARSEENV